VTDIPPAGWQTSEPVDQEQDDRHRLRALAAGDQAALEALRRRHGAGLLRYARARLPDPGLAEEVVADVFLAVWRRPDGYAARSTVRAWLFGITRRKVRDERRRAGLLVTDEAALLDVADPAPDPADVLLGAPSAHGLVAAVRRLPLALREVVALAFDQRLTYAEIADALDVPIGTVRSRLHEARARLRAATEDRP